MTYPTPASVADRNQPGGSVALDNAGAVASLLNFKGALRSFDDVNNTSVIVSTAMQGGKFAMISWASGVSTPGSYLIHLSTTTGFAGTGLIGMSPDAGGAALFIDNKGQVDNSQGIYISNTNLNTTYANAVSLKGDQSSTTSPLILLSHILGGTAPLIRFSANAWGAAQTTMDFIRSNGTTAWELNSQFGRFLLYDRLTVANAKLTAANWSWQIEASRGGAEVESRIYRYGGGSNAYPFRIGTVTDRLNFSVGAFGATTDGTETVNPVISIRADGSGNPELGFYGATPIVRPARAVTLADVIAVLATLGLTA